MIDSKKLLDQFLGAGAGDSGGAGGSAGGNALGGLGDMLNNALGGAGGGGASGGLGVVVGQVTEYAKNNPALSTVVAGGLASILLGGKGGGGPRLKTDALTLGGLAALGTLAYKAYQQYKINNPDAPAPTPQSLPQAAPAPVPQASAADDATARSIIVAMITAAKADGEIDATERQRIVGKLAENGLTPQEKAFLDQELAAPLDFNKVVDSATGPEHAIQLYAASLLAITPDQPAERAYLDMLAARLGLDAQLKASIEQTVQSAAA